MVDMPLPYSVMVQELIGVVEKLVVPHFMALACMRPRLCPGSCMSTTHASEPFIQVRFAGLLSDPSSPRPPKLHSFDSLK